MGALANEYNELNKIEIVNGKSDYKNRFFVKNDIGTGNNPLAAPLSHKEKNAFSATSEKPQEKRVKKQETTTKLVSYVIAIAGAVTIGAVAADELGIDFGFGKDDVYSRYLLEEKIDIELYPYEQGLSYYFLIYDYTPDGEMTVRVTGNGTDVSKPINEHFDEPYDDNPDDYGYEDENGEYDRERNAIRGSGYFEELAPHSEYVFAVYDGKYVLWEQSFKTEEKVQPITPMLNDEQINIRLSPDKTSVTYGFDISDYTPTGSMTLSVTDASYNYSRSEDISFDNASGVISKEGTFGGMAPATQYTIRIYDSGYLIWSNTFSTLALDRLTEDQVSLEIYEQYESLTYSLSLFDYTPLGDVTVSIYENNYLVASGNVTLTDAEQSGKTYLSARGGFEDLYPATEYRFVLTDSGCAVFEKIFSTLTPSATEDQLWIEYDAGVESVSYYMGLHDYEPYESLMIHLYQGENAVDWNYVRFEGDASTDDGQWADGTFEHLSPETDYVLILSDGGFTLRREEFTTLRMPQATADQVHILTNSDLDTVDFTVTFTDYEPVSYMAVKVIDENDNVIVTQTITLSDGEVTTGATTSYASGSIDDLTPDTHYYFVVTDTDYEIGHDEFYTLPIPILTENNEITEWAIYPSTTSVTMSITIQGYEARGDLTVKVEKDGVVCGTQELYASDVTGTYSCSRETISGLTAGTTYDLRIYDGKYVIYEYQFTTDS
ncbi:MAG: hypothetical protein J5762_04895 [Clostridia bacterium]|nr:hypothetical protein [Clostridia bacterium]